jgi:hypothetical protein
MHRGLSKFLRKEVPHDLTDDHKRGRCQISEELLTVLSNDELHDFRRLSSEMNLDSYTMTSPLTGTVGFA